MGVLTSFPWLRLRGIDEKRWRDDVEADEEATSERCESAAVIRWTCRILSSGGDGDSEERDAAGSAGDGCLEGGGGVYGRRQDEGGAGQGIQR